jgi:hypothetical protein
MSYALSLVRVLARVNWGRWIVDCPHPYCRDALTFDPLNSPPQLFECRNCGTQAEIGWPPEQMVIGVERLLMMRPDPADRCWDPSETLIDLMTQNGVLGVFDQLPAAPPGTSLLQVEEGRIVRDMLPALLPREALTLPGPTVALPALEG